MRSWVIAVGRATPGPAQDLFDLYAKRLAPPLGLIEVEERRKLPEATLRLREAELLLAVLPRKAVAVALDEHGTMLDSAGFARQLGLWRDAGTADLAFVIGGAAGHGAAVLARAQFTLSLGPMTWPHLLVRGMLAEQLYRGFALLSGHPYHRA